MMANGQAEYQNVKVCFFSILEYITISLLVI